VQFGGLSAGLLAHLGSRGVNSQFIASDMGLLAFNASLPGSSLATVESNNFHGVVENFAHTKIYTPLSISFYTDDQYKSLKFLEHWMEYAVGGNNLNSQLYGSRVYSYRMNYPNDPLSGYKSDQVKIYKFEPNIKSIMEYSFIGLYPKAVNSVNVAYGPNANVTRVTASFQYDRFIAGSTLSLDYFRNNAFGIRSILDTAEDIFSAPGQFLSNLIN